MFGGGGGGGLNPRKMQQMMEQMGIDVEDLDADRVVIELADGDQLVFEDAEVTRMDARGQQTYQVVGEPEERAGEVEASEESEESVETAVQQEDVELVVNRTGATEEAAREALVAADGDLAAAIDRLE